MYVRENQLSIPLGKGGVGGGIDPTKLVSASFHHVYCRISKYETRKIDSSDQQTSAPCYIIDMGLGSNHVNLLTLQRALTLLGKQYWKNRFPAVLLNVGPNIATLCLNVTISCKCHKYTAYMYSSLGVMI